MTAAYLNRLAAMCSWDTKNRLRTKKKKKKWQRKSKFIQTLGTKKIF